jgi:hypothetical protein
MTEIGAGFLTEDSQLFPRNVGELLALFAKRAWPRDTAKQLARRWDLDPSTAVNVVKGHGSERTITKALKAEGWPLLMALGEQLTGQTYQQHLARMIEEAANVQQLRAAHHDTVADLEARAAASGLLAGPPAGQPRRRDHGRR